jgi:NAD(P)-dependent dehydrogenase (short-subunit alcohol dehydrogenase family)
VEVAGKTFLVAGGASGLGAATAKALVAADANVVLADINEDQGDAIEAELGQTARFARTDVTQETDVAAAVARARSEFGALHGAVNCAGVGIAHLVLRRGESHPLDLFAKVVQVNLIGTFNVTRLAAAAMAETPAADAETRGIIVNTASIAAYDGQIGQAAYSASKGGVAALTLPLARELARHRIRVVTIAPGIFDTPMLMGLSEDARHSLEQQVPFPSRLGRPDEYAALALHIIENEMLNGEVIRLDGAIRMAPS